MQAEYEQLVHANAQLPATVALSPQQMVVDPDYVTSLQVTVIVVTVTVPVPLFECLGQVLLCAHYVYMSFFNLHEAITYTQTYYTTCALHSHCKSVRDEHTTCAYFCAYVINHVRSFVSNCLCQTVYYPVLRGHKTDPEGGCT
jgi:hypothetical protein